MRFTIRKIQKPFIGMLAGILSCAAIGMPASGQVSIATIPDWGKPPTTQADSVLNDPPKLVGTGSTPIQKPGLASVPWDTASPSVAKLPWKPAPLEEKRKQEEAARGDQGNQQMDAIEMKADFEGAAPLKIARVSNTYFSVDFENKFNNWFIFRIEGAKGKAIRIDLKNAPLEKWASLNPVYSYAASLEDPNAFQSKYPDPDAPPYIAFNGPQIPDTSSQQWHYITEVWKDEATSALCLVQTFKEDHVYVAMRVPYTPKLAEAMAKRLDNNPLAKVINVGKSEKGRPLHIIKIGTGGDVEERGKPCMVLYAREHASEQDTSWAVQGAVDFLLSDADEARAIRSKYTVLLIPLLDPDGAAIGAYSSITNNFVIGKSECAEVQAYGTFFKNWVDADKRMDLVVNLHNVESGESPHLVCPMMEPKAGKLSECQAFHNRVMNELQPLGYLVATEPWDKSYSVFRLGGYLNRCYAPLHMPYEINSQERKRHLSLEEVKLMGRTLIVAGAKFIESPESQPIQAAIRQSRRSRQEIITRDGKELLRFKDPIRYEYNIFIKANGTSMEK